MVAGGWVVIVAAEVDERENVEEVHRDLEPVSLSDSVV